MFHMLQHLAILLVLSVLTFGLVDNNCTSLSLPWATYNATYDSSRKLCRYENVRFAQAPVGPLRFQTPQDPLPGSTSPSGQISCMQVNLKASCTPGNPSDAKPSCSTTQGNKDEDCLFLDLYVPELAFSASQKLPVVVWFYGGAFLSGSKSQFNISKIPLYDGSGLVNASANRIIFAVPNYRLGAFGWMAGSYLEAQYDSQSSAAYTNVGLRDQRKALEFVRDNIGRVNGSNAQVSVWGESAGASSILHHLIADFGDQKWGPLFKKAVMQSPAFEWQWDRSGTINNIYSKVARLAGCPSGKLSCMKNITTKALDDANQQYFQETTSCLGLFHMGPSLDGTLIKQLPSVALPAGKFFNLDSIIVSHVANEVKRNGKGNGFIPRPIREKPCNEQRFQDFLKGFCPESEMAPLRQKVSKQYPANEYKNFFQCGRSYDQKHRVADVIRDAVFTCNTRLLFNAYHKKTPTYMMQYNLFAAGRAAVHGSDLLPNFYNNKIDMKNVFEECMNVLPGLASEAAEYFVQFAPAYQSYFTSHAIDGNPNSHTVGWAKDEGDVSHTWRTAADVGGKINNTLRAMGPLTTHFDPDYVDTINTEDACQFWQDLAHEVQGRSDRASDPVLVVQDSSDYESLQDEL